LMINSSLAISIQYKAWVQDAVSHGMLPLVMPPDAQQDRRTGISGQAEVNQSSQQLPLRLIMMFKHHA
jgi:hypothetical protein